ncbi:toxin-antitoxin system TumE family protein [Halalkalicoccus jeotgali]|uniref:Uncharacterized protein n=1 Tax=Halalkalicoccus jeotgali (strain DSM 18796 / CECT 7217 / JCM 14584 / KCTC 4019 / B3) TaxID=795797 RepID=L9VNQ3_HALJB|nr:DUF6516 family protein [Halalkalicoccus jeotgali]ELY38597.1 hypothetical protein C497_06644 [Halalkalicoccus jeotgali B3]
MSGDEATLILSESLDFPETGRIVRMNVWSVPASDAYPDGIKYRLHYGTGEGETILRYDNSTYEYPGDYKAVLERFRTEVENHERTD